MSTSVREQTERWFLRKGFPHAIEDYAATRDVFTRAAPFLAVVFLAELFASFGDRYSGWKQAGIFLVGLAIMGGGVVAVNRLRGRRPFQLPDKVGVPELTMFVVVPALLPLVGSSHPTSRALLLVVVNIALVGLVYAVNVFSLLGLLRFGGRQVARHVRRFVQLFARVLPLMLLFSAFLFLNAEMWQVAHDLPLSFYVILVCALLAIGVAFVAMRTPRAVDELASFADWAEVNDLVGQTDAPAGLVEECHPAGSPADTAALSPADRVNVGLLVLVSQLVQVLIVGCTVTAFYVAFGLLAVREDTMLQWTTQASVDSLTSFTLFGDPVLLTREHLVVAGFIGAFSVLQFAVSSTTDTAYREEFYKDVVREIRALLAVRSLYLALPHHSG